MNWQAIVIFGILGLMLSPFAIAFALLVIASAIALWPITILILIIALAAWSSGQKNLRNKRDK